MPIIHRFDPPPPAWPPPRTAEAIDLCDAYVEARDPLGHAIHLLLAAIYLAVMDLSAAAESIAFVALVGYTLLRVPNLWRSLAPLAGSAVVWTLVAWCVYSAISITWCEDRAGWAESMESFRAILILPALYPMRRRWRVLLGALLLGVAVQSIAQLAQAFGVLAPRWENPIRHAGLARHPGHVATFAACAILIAGAWLRDTRTLRETLALVAAIALACVSLLIAFGRGALIGLAVGAPITAILLWRRAGFGLSRRGWLALSGVTLAIALGLGGLLLSKAGAGALWQVQDMQERTDEASSTGARLLWWRMALDNAREHPILGVGAGSTYASYLRNPRLVEAASRHPELDVAQIATVHPHSLYAQSLSEGGAIGLLLVLAWVGFTFRAALRAPPLGAVTCGLIGGLVVWFVAAGFEGLHLAGRTAGLVMALTALTALPMGQRH